MAERHLDEAIEIVRANALFADSVDWGRVRGQARERIARPPTSTQAAYPAIRFVLDGLGDHHSFLQLSDSLRALEVERVGVTTGSDAASDRPAPSPFGTRMRPEAARLSVDGSGIGFVFLPQGRRDDAFATRFAAMVDSIADGGVCGWVVDLRGNGGGNMWPMLAGIGSLLGEGEAGGWVYSDGAMETYRYDDGRGIVRDTTGQEHVRSTAADPPLPISHDVAIAVLIDRGTGSSGEVMAVAFKGRPNTRFFGEPTYGVTTATEGFRMSDGANLVLAVATLADRHGRTYVRHVPPDEIVPSPPDAIPERADDDAIRRAADWVSRQDSCRS